jgi:hypothetical protein
MKKYDILILKSVNGNMTSNFDNKFVYPEKGLVTCKNWKNDENCGNGLHGFAWGEGQGELSHLNRKNAKWLVIGVNKKDGYVELSGKVKFKKGYVLFCGSRSKTVKFLIENGADKSKCLFSVNINKKYKSTVFSGDYGTSISGSAGISLTKDNGKSISGAYGISISEFAGIAISGDYGKSIIRSGKCKSGLKGLLVLNNKTFYIGKTYNKVFIHPNVFYTLNGKGHIVKSIVKS